MKEAALLFDKLGRTLYTHIPLNRTSGFIPHSPAFENVVWELLPMVAGLAHIHPWNGEARPSHEDLTTFSAMERAYGKRLYWPIATFDDLKCFYDFERNGNYRSMPHHFIEWSPIHVELLRTLATKDNL